MARRTRSFSDKFWNDKHGRFVVWQKPNWLLTTWFVAFILSVILPEGGIGTIVSAVAGISIFVWALLELFRGADYFRRTLGFCILLLFAVSHFL